MRRGEESQVVRIRGDELKTAPIAKTPIIILRLYMGVCAKSCLRSTESTNFTKCVARLGT